jgi:hypothetical protein
MGGGSSCAPDFVRTYLLRIGYESPKNVPETCFMSVVGCIIELTTKKKGIQWLTI